LEVSRVLAKAGARLINCAGIMDIPEQRDSRGYEIQFTQSKLALPILI